MDPHTCGSTCVKRLTDWAKGSRNMSFAVPMVWQGQQDHSSHCYFSFTKIKGVTSKSTHTVQNPSLPFAVRPVVHNDDLPVPHPAARRNTEDDPERRGGRWR